MNIIHHELDLDADDDDLSDLDEHFSFRHRLSDLSGGVLKLRALRALDKGAVRYPIHRHLRCAVRRGLEEVFDDLALNLGLEAHRLAIGAVLLDGPGALVQAKGRRKSDYCSCTFEIWAVNKTRAEQICAAILHLIGEQRIRDRMFTLDWHFAAFGGTQSTSFEEIADDVVHDEAYPVLEEPVSRFIKRYLDSKEAVLVLQGPPGTGKTRLVRAVLAEMSCRKGENAFVMYTADKRVIESDKIFVEFLTGSHDAVVIEDADHMLMTRTRGNQDLHRFLAISDGVVRAQGRKIIFTTNLPNVGDLDEALLRPGRCFANVRVRPLSPEEAKRLVDKLCPTDAQREQALAVVLAGGAKGVSLANIYRACDAGVL
jgi:hypothetical protein